MESQAEVIPTTQENNNNGDTTINNLPSSNPSSLPFYQISKRYTLAILSHIGLILTISIFSYYHKILDLNKYTDNDESMKFWYKMMYILVQIPAAIFSYKYSATHLFGICILGNSIVTFLFPIISKWNDPALLIVTLFHGLFMGATFPSFYSIWRYWAPPSERTTLVAIGYTGILSGRLIFNLISTCSFKLENILHMYGLIGILWHFTWRRFAFEHPSQHPSIMEQELTYLQKTITITHEIPVPSIPWKKILKNTPIATLIIVDYLYNLSIPLISVSMDKKQLLINNSVRLISILVTSYAIDLLLQKTSIRKIILRKIHISGGLITNVLLSWIAWILFLTFGIGYVDDLSPVWYNIASYLTTIVFYLPFIGLYVNYLEISGKYAGITIAMRNMMLMSNYLFMLLSDYMDFHIFRIIDNIFFRQFSYMFLFICGALFYGIFGKSEQQDLDNAQGLRFNRFTYNPSPRDEDFNAQ
ncbi:vesicular glutamate transporter 3-like isoform X1 [Chrysoperla carnea]|uniref:vesicular glutamate transporter 3-like isoform X1 n=1 Tax=Chrysoperla carnea TaxID=189513 RepID=UPI001D095F2F|nr:vesicular glutamate transporter 3-like isoform X1 [Chrysoperla carnea]